MCGIAGIVALSPNESIDPAELRALSAPIAHRGPDDEGTYVDPKGRCGLAFRRLSVIDPAGGHQPMTAQPGSSWIVFNGEIYNFRELRDELIAAGRPFRTQSDTETILHAVAVWGDGFLERLNGMFALAVWDEQAGELLLARDRFGKKPLVCAEFGGMLYFASEAKAILALPGAPRRLNPRSIYEYLLYQYVPAPAAALRGFFQVPPGTRVRIPAGRGARPEPKRWWSLPTPERFAGSYGEAREELRLRLTRAVERRLISDVPLGAFLSGGLDSSTVVALMSRLGVSPLRTFSVGFAQAAFDETEHARAVARAVGAEHHEQRAAPGAAEMLRRLARQYDQPLADSSAIPTLLVAQHARSSVTVALTGDGGDEAFLGYDRYRAAAIASRLDAWPGSIRSMLSLGARATPQAGPRSLARRARRFLEALSLPPAARYLSWVNVWTPDLLRAVCRQEFLEQAQAEEVERAFTSAYDRAYGSPAERANRLDFETYLPFDILAKVDIASMAVGLECRCPLLDPDVVTFALSLPERWRAGKRVFRDVARPLLPPQILARRKMGFGVPMADWLRGELRPALETHVLSPESHLAHLLDLPAVRRIAADHLEGRADHAHRLWALLMLEAWWREWGPSAA